MRCPGDQARRLCGGVALWLLSHSVAAPFAWAAEGPRAWAKRVGFPVSHEAAPRTVLVATGTDPLGRPVFDFKGAKEFDSLGYFQLLPVAATWLTAKLNVKAADGGDPALALAPLVAQWTPDFVVLAAKSWSLFSGRSGKLKPVLEPTPPKDQPDAAGIQRYLASALGYQAVVLAVEGDLILAAIAGPLLGERRQAVLLLDSASRGLLPQTYHGEAEVAAVLELVQAEGPFASFRPLIPDPNWRTAAKPGAKLILP